MHFLEVKQIFTISKWAILKPRTYYVLGALFEVQLFHFSKKNYNNLKNPNNTSIK